MPLPLMPLTRHLPIRPSWACRDCARPWPCAPGRADLAIEYAPRPVLLFYYMSAQMVDFTADLTARRLPPDPAHLYPRFVDWIRPATTALRAA